MEDILRILSRGLKFFELGETEIRIYSLLQRESLTPRQIAKALGLSERIVREKLKHLLELGLIERTLVNRGWLGYVYYAKAPQEALKGLLSRIESTLKAVEKETNLKG
ncbi:helix-turn-helix domain-containing protein [Thermococcus waiotapuensis]|uniref:Helix-turn-helix domain-containing protein n=1 Tax=Thermococcus waiotapuensis TaxID=90909 RepID=A0AAE4NV07_9EURY|nr:helix-turn-helix domain-containing protein [Thermococcus waiotapuensis]MDV3104369.1 helix-turn-helix domain-containing protein [Thermococcus waiotapuensis]